MKPQSQAQVGLGLWQMYTDFEVKQDSLKSEGESSVYSKDIKEEEKQCLRWHSQHYTKP